MNDEVYMQLALDLAKKGIGSVNPNPLVGAVVVKDGKVIGQGYHERYGGLHAERNALAACSESPQGATIYVNLEPCCHYGKTPPCTEALIEQGIARVVVGTLDPNEKVAGKGVQILKDAGMEVVTGVLKEKCIALNEVFFHYITKKTPFVVMKYAMTLDGKITSAAGKGCRITGEESFRKVHEERSRLSAIMIGIGTEIADDPMLTCRIEGGRDPIRIICDSALKTPLDSKIVRSANKVPTIIATLETDKKAHKIYTDMGCEVLVAKEKNGKVDLADLMVKIGERKIDSVLLEGGSTLNFCALQEKIVNKVQCYIAPNIFGGVYAKTPVGGMGFEDPQYPVKLKNTVVTAVGEDVLIEGEVDYGCSQE